MVNIKHISKDVRGVSTLELLIAFAIFTLSLTAVISMLYGNQSAAVDTQTNSEALSRAQKFIEKERQLAAIDYLSASSTSMTETVGGLTYTEVMSVADLTPCQKVATTTITWTTSPLRTQRVTLTTLLTDVAGALSLGGDCYPYTPMSGWTNPTRYASDTFNPGKPISLDVLDRIAYVSMDRSPFFKIANTRSATLGQSGGLFVTYANGFAASGLINALDAINWTNPSTGAKKVYLFAAMDDTTNQLRVYDVTTPTAPTLAATVALSACVANSFPQGWYISAYGNRLYMTTRETAGPELHVFDITTPSAPVELSVGSSGCKGYEINGTIEQFVVRDQVINGSAKRYLYAATDQDSKEIRVLDITNSLSISEATSVDLSGTTDGASVYLVGTKLYFGRDSGSGDELFVYDATKPASGLTLLGSEDIGTDVLGLRVAGPFAFLATSKTNKEFQVWGISNPSNITNVALYNFGNVVGSGIDYEPDYVYVTGQATPNFQMLYSP